MKVLKELVRRILAMQVVKQKIQTTIKLERGRTGHAEAVEVIYDPKVVSFGTLVHVFFGSHDPTTPNRQGPDYGSQYRSIAFYTNDEEREIIQKYIETLEEGGYFSKKLLLKSKPLEKFYYAEEYHQDYEKK
jgi:peptide-methionine (S)-S-oxide reductase